MMNKWTLLLAFILAIEVNAQNPAPANKQTQPVAIVNGTLHVGNGDIIEEALVYFDKGQIIYAGPLDENNRLKYVLPGVKVIDAKGKHIYPGLIAIDTYLGLNEIDAVRATRDYNEVGEFNPNVRSLIAYNTDSKITPTVRFNGVLLGEVKPTGGRISGSSCVVQFDAWNWQDALVKDYSAIHLNWPVSYSQHGWWAEPGEVQNNKWDDKMLELRTFFEEARQYGQQKNEVINLKYEAMQNIFSGKSRLFIHANDKISITTAIAFAKQYGITPVIVGGADAWMLCNELKLAKVPVVITRTHRLPMRWDEPVDAPFRLPAILHDSGVSFCIADVNSWEQRNLPFQAGQAVACGLPREAALQSITLTTAKILGIDNRYGSVENGKSATLFISDGDALDMKSNQLAAAFIDGRAIELTNNQRILYDKYRQKYGLK